MKSVRIYRRDTVEIHYITDQDDSPFSHTAGTPMSILVCYLSYGFYEANNMLLPPIVLLYIRYPEGDSDCIKLQEILYLCSSRSEHFQHCEHFVIVLHLSLNTIPFLGYCIF